MTSTIITLEQRLKEAVVCFTDSILIHGKGNVDSYHWAFRHGRSQTRADTLYIGVRGRTYTQIMESVYNGLLNANKRYHKINMKNRALLYNLWRENYEIIEHWQKVKYFR